MKTKGTVCSSHEWRRRPSRKRGIRPLEVLEKEVHSFIHETFPGQFWTDNRDAKMSWPHPLPLKSSPRGKDPPVIVIYTALKIQRKEPTSVALQSGYYPAGS